MRYGLMAALVTIGIGLIFNLTNLIDYTDNSNPGNIASSVINWVAIIVAMVLAVKIHRNEDLGGFITFGRAFGLAFLTGLVVAVIGFVWSFVFMQFIDPSILQVVEDATRTSMVDRGMSESEMEQAWGITKMFISAPAIAFFWFYFYADWLRSGRLDRGGCDETSTAGGINGSVFFRGKRSFSPKNITP
jgi:hypothetical protein